MRIRKKETDSDEQIEKQFAVKAVQHMETYWAILERVRGSALRLTKLDDDILEHLQTDFPEFDPAIPINEDEMKSAKGKEKWRKFMMAYEKKVDDYNFGTMMRVAPNVEYGRDETIFGEYGVAGSRKVYFCQGQSSESSLCGRVNLI